MRKQSYIVLAILFIIAFFIIGVRYGQRLEQFNKLVAAIPTPTTKTTQHPTLTPSLETYLNFTHDDCKMKLLIPDSFTIKDKSTNSANIVNKESNKTVLTFKCAQNLSTLTANIDTKNTATASLTFQGKTIEGREDLTNYYFVISNPLRTLPVFFTVHKNLYQLLNETLTFL